MYLLGALPLLIFGFAVQRCLSLKSGMLFPRESESRQIQELNGMWNFRADHHNDGFNYNWFKLPLKETGPVISMPVPSSYNDITTDGKLQNFVGWVWYDRNVYVSSLWQKLRVILRVDSAHYNSVVWVNGAEVMKHEGGHLPFEVDVAKWLNFERVNLVTIAVNNSLTPHTLPPGTIEYMKDRNKYPPGYFVQNLQFDFFNYAGLHRRVRLYTTPQTYIDDVTITTRIDGTTGYVNYTVNVVGSDSHIDVQILDTHGKAVANTTGTNATLNIAGVQLWWPYSMMTENFGYLYTLQLVLTGRSSRDVYRQPFGVRTVKVTERQILINNKPFYCHGVAKHEDSDIRGKGLDFALIARDFHMLKWLGANCFRTSHYPYAEEILDEADAQGIVVIDESPGVGIVKVDNFGNISLQHHLEVMEELVRRDKNRPSVIMWSVANEPASSLSQAQHYFKTVIAHTRHLDPTRPVTFVTARDYYNDKAVQYVDVVCINRYYGWYHDAGQLDVISYQLSYDLQQWYKAFHKPLMITEYGADTVPGLHSLPPSMFTEDFQVDFMKRYHAVFDELKRDFLVGEMVWNFADFMTAPSITRVVGNKKGILTRQREPKAAGHLMRNRYWTMINGSLSDSLRHSQPALVFDSSSVRSVDTLRNDLS